MKRLMRIVICGTFLFSSCTTINNNTESLSNKSNENHLCEITFKNYNAEILYYTSVKYGETAVYQGETPTRPASDSYYYIFKGWDKPLTNITEDMVFIAQYEQRDNNFTITWVVENTTVRENYHYGEMPTYKNGTPTKEPTVDYTYTFSNWYPVIESVTSDQTYTAVFSQKEAKPLADEYYDAWLLHGAHLLADGSKNDWSIPSEEQISKKQLTPINMGHLRIIDKTLFETLSTKNIKYLYKYEGAQFGTNDAGYNLNVPVGDSIYPANGSYAFVCSKIKYNDNHESYTQEWFPAPQNDDEIGNYAESLTPETLFTPSWPDVDPNGLSQDPVVLKSGIFTLVIAEYDEGPAEGTPNYGIAAILTKAKQGIPIKPFDYREHTYGVIGSFSMWSEDIALSNTETVGNRVFFFNTISFQKYDEFVIIADSKWLYVWHYSELDLEVSESSLEENVGTIRINKAGSYKVAIGFDNSSNATIHVVCLS